MSDAIKCTQCGGDLTRHEVFCGFKTHIDDFGCVERLTEQLATAQAEIERLRGELDECRWLLSIAEDAWDCGAWNSLIAMQQLYLTRDWYEAVRKVTNEYDDVH